MASSHAIKDLPKKAQAAMDKWWRGYGYQDLLSFTEGFEIGYKSGFAAGYQRAREAMRDGT